MIDYLPAVLLDHGHAEIDLGRLGQIVQTATRRATDVVMGFHDGVEARFSADRFQTSYLSGLAKDIEVAIDRPQADPRQLPTNRAIQLGGGGMALGAPERLQEDAALDGVSFGLG